VRIRPQLLDSPTARHQFSNLGLKKAVFEGNEISGIEYVAVGENEKNPQVMIVFQNGLRFYVFNFGFIGGDVQVAEIMEGIVKTLSLNG
jgi:hypothetical protein